MNSITELPSKQSVVLYTDGGSRWHLGGIGVHGYVFDEAISKTYHGHKNFVATKNGYQIKSNSTMPVNVLKYLDYTCAVPNCTNNMAETLAVVAALEFIIANDFTDAYFFLDSEYTLKGITEWLPGWKINGWRKNDGFEVSNKDIWLKIDNLLQTIDKTYLHWKWIKGHSDNLGNDKADYLATKSLFSLRKNLLLSKSLIDIDALTGTWTESVPKNYWIPKISYNKLLCQPRIFINSTIRQLEDNNLIAPYTARYFMINIGADDALFGKPAPRGSYAVLYTKTKDPVIEHLAEAHAESRQYIPHTLPIYFSEMALFRMHEVLKPSTYYDILTNGTKYLLPLKDRADMYDANMNNLTFELRTALAYDGQAVFMELDTILKLFIADNYKKVSGMAINYTELFNEFYERVESPKKTTTKLKESIGEEGALELTCQFCRIDSEGVFETPLHLVIGVDIPSRNVLASLTDDIVSIGILTWNHISSPDILRYGLVVKTTHDIMFWSAQYSNLKIIKKYDLKSIIKDTQPCYS